MELVVKRREQNISDLIVLFSLTNLLLIPKKPTMFIEMGGLKVLKTILKNPENKIKTNYFGMLCYWILSYEGKFVAFASTPSVSSH